MRGLAKRNLIIAAVILVLAAFIATGFCLYNIFRSIRVEYAYSSEAMGNPLMGYAPSAWHETVNDDVTLLYVDITWRELEPEEGVYDWEQIESENQFSRWRAEGKHVVLRFVCDIPSDEEHMDIPDWLYEKIDGDGTKYDYKTWTSEAAMKSGIDSLIELCDRLFPGVNINVYVPPSNIMSDGAEEFLAREYPGIRTISGIYFDSDDIDFYCTQEFDVTPEGIVAQPRIISGCDLTPYMKIAAMSELNFHYVNSHFTHPDDSLDPDRGAEMGWEALKAHFQDYLDWLYTSAPNIRNFTGSEMSAAIQRYVALAVSTEVSQDRVEITLGNFYDEAQLMVRFNDQTPGEVTGGSLEQLTDTLYVLHAYSPNVTITLDAKG